MKCWTERWPAQGPYAVGENRLCPLTRGPLAAKGQTVEGERRTRPPTARPRKNEDELVLHTKPRGVVVTDLSEESVFEAGRYAFAVIPTRRSGTPRRSQGGRPVGPLQANPSAWSLAREGPLTGSPDRSWGRVRSLGGMVPRPPGHELLKSSRLRLSGAELFHYRANRLSEQPRLWDGCVQ